MKPVNNCYVCHWLVKGQKVDGLLREVHEKNNPLERRNNGN